MSFVASTGGWLSLSLDILLWASPFIQKAVSCNRALAQALLYKNGTMVTNMERAEQKEKSLLNSWFVLVNCSVCGRNSSKNQVVESAAKFPR